MHPISLQATTPILELRGASSASLNALHPPPSANPTQRAICCRIFTPAALPKYPAASVRDYCSGAYSNLGRGKGPAPRGQRTERGHGRTDARKPSAQKKRDRGWGGRGMRYSASEKAEIIRLVAQSALPVKRTLEKLGIRRATFYRWCDVYQSGGPETLDDRSPRPDRVWNRIPDDIRERIVQLALDEPTLSPRELAVRFTDTEKYFA